MSDLSANNEQIQFWILGPLEVTAGDERIRLRSSRQQVILAVLLLEAGKVVGVDRLIEAVWDDSPPPTARKQVQICVSALRRLLRSFGGRDLITTHPAGYLLCISDNRLDCRWFERLRAASRAALRKGQLAAAAASLRAALEMWHGSALDSIASRHVQSRAARLDECRWSVLDECIELELRLGRHREVIGELVAAVAAQPLRERLRGQLMVALYRSGRQAEALEVYRAARRQLADELGLEPCAELRRLHDAILAGHPDLPWQSSRPAGTRDAANPEPFRWMRTPSSCETKAS